MAKEKDIILKNFMGNADVFSDAVNYCIYDGRQEVMPEDLKELDTEESLLIADAVSYDKTTGVQKNRDILRSCVIKKTGKATYVIIGIENQSEIHYAMPVKNMIYDALNYGKQVKAYEKRHRQNGDKVSSGEFLSGMTKEDKLIPVITLTVCFNPNKWSGPRSIHEMLATKDKEILSHVNDYRLNLIAAGEIEDFTKFTSRLGHVLEFIAVSEDKESLRELIVRDRAFFSNVESEIIQLLNICVNARVKVEEGAEENDMCKAIEDMISEGREEGKIAGEANGKKHVVKKMYENGMSIADISKYTDIAISTIKGMIGETV